ncbi:MAG: hypothetical protein WCC87_18820 [Candidatus Korobacteraceae bacterium]
MKTQTIDQQVLASGFSSANHNQAGSFVAPHAARRTAIAFGCLLLATSLCLHKHAAAQQTLLAATPAATQSAMKAVIPVFLDKSVDSRKLKSGEEIDGQVAVNVQLKDGTVIPRGAKVVGHVTEAKARSKGDAESALGIVFDKIDLPGGNDLAITSVVQAVGPSLNSDLNTGGGIGYGSLSEMMEKPPSPTSSPTSKPLLNEQSAGVLGIKNLKLGADGVLISDQKTVKLDSGTQMMVQAQIAAM